jgi:hypothetical protein
MPKNGRFCPYSSACQNSPQKMAVFRRFWAEQLLIFFLVYE